MDGQRKDRDLQFPKQILVSFSKRMSAKLQAAPATALPFAALPAAGGLNVIFVFLFQRKKVDLQGSE